MANEFIILKNGILEIYDKYEDIPETFDNLIKFLPEMPPEPHSHEEHQEINSWNDKLAELLKRETK